jgi:molybdenum cofactor cytidylyltransferase
MVPGIILAAGESSRMGRPKALLPFGDSGRSFVQHIAQALCDGGVEEALVVGRADDEALQGELARVACPCRYVVNPDPGRGQLSSLLCGLDVADRPGVTGVLVTPVDVPFVSPAIVRALLERFGTARALVVRAVHAGRHGHPVIFSRAIFADLRRADPARGAKAVLHAHASAIVDVETDSPGVTEDVDSPADYDRLFPRASG